MLATTDYVQEASNVSFSYDQTTSALDDVSFSIPRGAIFAVLGPHGSGKTTLFNLLRGAQAPSKGTIMFLGSPFDNRCGAGPIGWVPSNSSELSLLTLDEYFKKLRCRQPDFDLAFAYELLVPFELSEVRTRLIGALSDGLQKKTQLVGAMAHRPTLLILDEPFAGLDPQSQFLLLAALHELQRQGTTVVVSSHQIEVIHRVATHVAILNRGQLCVVGAPDELLQREHATSLRDLYLKVTGTIEATAERTHLLRQLLEPPLVPTLEPH